YPGHRNTPALPWDFSVPSFSKSLLKIKITLYVNFADSVSAAAIFITVLTAQAFNTAATGQGRHSTIPLWENLLYIY
ncbi:MAG: hypothetical protein IJB55_01065, partial [Firmicutes bacterium]|nr:hypothetical protein [Bacillota bacterium]